MISLYNDLVHVDQGSSDEIYRRSVDLYEEGRVLDALEGATLLAVSAQSDNDRMSALLLQAQCFDSLGAENVELTLYDHVIENYSIQDDGQIKLKLVWVHYNKAIILGRQGKAQEALVEYERAIALAGTLEKTSEILGASAKSRYNMANLLNEMQRREEAESVLSQIISECSHFDDTELLEQVGKARVSLGMSFMATDKKMEAIKVFADLLAMPREVLSCLPDLMVDRARVSYAIARAETQRDETSLNELEAFYENFKDRSDEEYVELSAFALFCLADSLEERGEKARARKMYNLLISEFSDRGDSLSDFVELARGYIKAEEEREYLPSRT